MPSANPVVTLVSLAAVVLLAAPSVRADTVVLKNGRRIVAQSAVRENGSIVCETPSGRLVLPESMVARIDTDDLAFLATPRPNRSAVNVQMSAPSIGIAADLAPIVAQVVH